MADGNYHHRSSFKVVSQQISGYTFVTLYLTSLFVYLVVQLQIGSLLSPAKARMCPLLRLETATAPQDVHR